MIDDHIGCLYQQTEGFDFEVCHRCKHYEYTFGGKNPAPHCRKQKSPAHKRGFESAALLYKLGMPFHVVVDGPSE